MKKVRLTVTVLVGDEKKLRAAARESWPERCREMDLEEQVAEVVLNPPVGVVCLLDCGVEVADFRAEVL